MSSPKFEYVEWVCPVCDEVLRVLVNITLEDYGRVLPRDMEERRSESRSQLSLDVSTHLANHIARVFPR
jgi:hypothetical protein